MRPTPGEVRERDRDRQRLASLFMVVGSAFPLPARAGSENTFDSSHDLAHEGQSPPDEMSRTPLVVRASSAPLDDSAAHPAVFSTRVIGCRSLPIPIPPSAVVVHPGTLRRRPAARFGPPQETTRTTKVKGVTDVVVKDVPPAAHNNHSPHSRNH